MSSSRFDTDNKNIAWCPGCGNFGILAIVKEVLSELDIPQEQLVFVSGIGQAAKLPQYVPTHYFNGLHGRALPPATGIKVSNPSLTVVAASGDGDMYGEGGNHFIHCIRRNPDITNLVHNNMVYGLTKGQASPTSERGFKTPVQTGGVILEPFNPLSVAIALNASFVARAFMGHKEQAKEMIKQAIVHKGYALVDIFQPCVTFNPVNTYQWFKDNTYYLDESHPVTDRTAAFAKATEEAPWPLGVFYRREDVPTFENEVAAVFGTNTPLFQRERTPAAVQACIDTFKK